MLLDKIPRVMKKFNKKAFLTLESKSSLNFVQLLWKMITDHKKDIQQVQLIHLSQFLTDKILEKIL